MFGGEYPQKLSELKVEFVKAQQTFDRSVQLETFKAAVENGEHNLPSVYYIYHAQMPNVQNGTHNSIFCVTSYLITKLLTSSLERGISV